MIFDNTSVERRRKPKQPPDEPLVQDQPPPIDRERDERRWRQYWRDANNVDRPNRGYSPWLVIRHLASDTGQRPLPSGEVFWNSPDIWIESSDSLGNPVAGEPNFVHAIVRNFGMADAFPVKVDFFWADPSLGLGPGDMIPIGSERVLVRRGEIKDVKCPWVPVLVNQGHECVVVNCSNHVLDPIIHRFQPALDRHVGQRNFHVVSGPPGGTIAFAIWLNNPYTLRAATTVAVMSQRFTPLGDGRRRAANISIGDATVQVASTRFRLRSQLTEGSVLYRDSSTAHGFLGARLNALDQSDRTACAPQERFSQLHAVDLEAFERRKMELSIEIPSDAELGETNVFHFAQRLGALTVGGYSLLVRVERRITQRA